MTKVKDLIHALARFDMESRVYICDENGVKCDVGYTKTMGVTAIKLWPAKKGWHKTPK